MICFGTMSYYVLLGLCLNSLVFALPIEEHKMVPEVENIKLDEIVDTAVTKVELHDQQIKRIQQDMIHIGDVLESQSLILRTLQNALMPTATEPIENQSAVGEEKILYNEIQVPKEEPPVRKEAREEIHEVLNEEDVEAREEEEEAKEEEVMEEEELSHGVESQESEENVENVLDEEEEEQYSYY